MLQYSKYCDMTIFYHLTVITKNDTLYNGHSSPLRWERRVIAVGHFELDLESLFESPAATKY